VLKKIVIAVAGLALVLLAILAFSSRRGKDAALLTQSGSTASSSALLNLAKESQAKGDQLSARKAYEDLISSFPNSPEVINWQKRAEEINMKLLFSPVITPKSILYEIKPGDTLAKIAREFKTTTELIKRSNNLSSDIIVPGRKIKVWNAPFSILVDKSQNILILKSEEEVLKTYIVSTGKNNSTPVGAFKITSKLVNPTWFNKAGAAVPAGSPQNILGTRWMGIDKPTYGLHGTTEPQNLGQQVTQGCVRLSNPDVEELYSIVPLGTEVIITD
jgi:lipoprotein-anchoring transpeptidase ErfK/SrfK